MASPPTRDRWYVCAVEPRRETRVEALLAEQGFETWLPMERRRDGSIRWLFGGYLFARFDARGEAWKRIHTLKFVHGILPLGRAPIPVGAAEMSALRELCPNGVFDPWPRHGRSHSFAIDDLVRLIGGPLAGAYGTVQWTRSKSVRVIAACFGRTIGVTIRPDQAEFAQPDRDDHLAGAAI